MSLARNISLFVNIDQGREKRNLEIRKNSLIFDVFSGCRRFSSDQDQEIEQTVSF